ncbi:MAG: hypothetical protein HGB26_03935 [Desulfobulbaceae bacterium]|nr:hypothetical protein [Desulfobulbaceae bacterium]
MKNIILMHCYSDENRGDAGIIDSTCHLFRDCSDNDNIIINGVSTFNILDIRFRDHHYFTRLSLDGLLPSFFPEPFIKIDESKSPNILHKLITFSSYFIKSIFLCIMPSLTISRIIYSKHENQTFKEIMKSDAVVSKGGSFLYSLKGINGDLFLIRMLMQLVVPIRFGKPVFIFCQSVGPFENIASRILFKWVISRVKGCYLRETGCLKYFNQYGFDKSKVSVVTDAAFYYSKTIKEKKISYGVLKKVGITARPHVFINTEGKDNYINALVDYVIWVVKSKGAKVYLVPQVIGPSNQEDDRVALAEIYNRLPHEILDGVEWISDNLSPAQLIEVYRELDLLVGTRLHSVIFALCSGTKVIGIAYHGTKSQGILGDLGISSNVLSIESISSKELIEATNALDNKPFMDDNCLCQKVLELENAGTQILNQ